VVHPVAVSADAALDARHRGAAEAVSPSDVHQVLGGPEVMTMLKCSALGKWVLLSVEEKYRAPLRVPRNTNIPWLKSSGMNTESPPAHWIPRNAAITEGRGAGTMPAAAIF
jgi:hypothetical protein